MQEFFYEGNVQKFIELIPEGYTEHFILLAFSAYQDGNAADAVKLMRKALTLQKKSKIVQAVPSVFSGEIMKIGFTDSFYIQHA